MGAHDIPSGARASCPPCPAFCRTTLPTRELRYSQVSRLFCDLQKSRRQHAGGSEQNARVPLSYCERNFC